MKKIPAFFVPLLFLAVGFLIYSNSFNSPFRFDDHVFLEDRMDVRDPGRIWRDGETFRKIPFLTFSFNYLWTGVDVWSWHLVNILFHVAAAFMVATLSRMMWRSKAMAGHPWSAHAEWLSVVSGLVFLCHPVATSAVTYIYQRLIVMATLFHLLTLYCYARARLGQKPAWFLPAAAFAVLAFFTKQINFTLPLTLLLFEITFCSVSFKKFISYSRWLLPLLFALAFFYLKPFRVNVLDFNLDTLRQLYPENMNSHVTWGQWIPTQLNVIRTYWRLLVFPMNQMLDYDYPIASGFGETSVWLSAGLQAALLIAAILFWKRRRLVSFGVLFMAAVFSLEFVAVRDTIFEHRLYLPMAGFAFLLPTAMGTLITDFRKCVGLLLAILCALSLATFARNAVWADEERFWKENIRLAPNIGRPYYSLGAYYAMRGEHEKALPYHQKALEIWPGYADAWSNLGKSLEHVGRMPEAILYYKKAIDIAPQLPAGLNNYGSALVRAGRYDEAREAYLKAIMFRPDNYESMNNMGSSYARQGRYDEAMEWYQKSIKANPLYADAHNNIGSILGNRKDYAGAERAYREASRLDPKRPEPHNNLALLYLWQGRYEDALQEYQIVLKISSAPSETYNNIGAILARLGRYEEAEKHLRKALALKKNYTDAFLSLSNIYLRQNRFDKARQILEEALRSNPNEALLLDNLRLVQEKEDSVDKK